MASASTSAPHHRGNTANLPKSHFQQTVCLADWWLVKAENDVQGRRLAVAGLTAWGKQAIRVFTSAPILKRYDVCTVETSDGICVILDGLINKARTLENGFPSDVFNYFVFGFPPYWKEYDEKFVAKAPPSKDISRDNLLEKLSRQLGSMEGAQPQVDSHDKYSGSQGKTEAKGRQKSKKGKSLTVPLPNTSVSGLQKEAYSGGTFSVEDHTAPELPVNDLKNEMKSLSDLSCVGIKVQAVIDKHVDYSQIRDSGGTQSACHLNKKRRTEEAADNLRKMGRNKKTRTKFDRDVSSSERVLSHNEVRVTTRSISSLKMKHMNYKKSAEISDGDQEAGCRNNWNSEDKGVREIKTKSKILKVKNKATESPCTPAASTKSRRTPASVDTKRDTVSTRKNSLSKKGNASDMETSQKSAPVSKETPKSEKEKVQSVSPQSCSFNRSRAGRLLMPTLQFWRNQRAVYNADRTITGIYEGMHPQQLRNEGGSTPHGERKKLV